MPRPRGRRTHKVLISFPNFDENSESTVDGQSAGAAMIAMIVIRRPGIPVCFLHVADPWATGLQFSRPGRARTLVKRTCHLPFTILRAPCSSADPPHEHVLPQTLNKQT